LLEVLFAQKKREQKEREQGRDKESQRKANVAEKIITQK